MSVPTWRSKLPLPLTVLAMHDVSGCQSNSVIAYRSPDLNWDCTGFEAVASAIGLDRRIRVVTVSRR